MIAKAKARFIRISPRKARQVADLIRGKTVNDALGILSNVNKSATVYIEEVLQSAVSNAKQKESELNTADLYISRFTVDGGPAMVRYRAASMGRAVMIKHRTSHLKVELEAKEGVQRLPKKRGRAKTRKE